MLRCAAWQNSFIGITPLLRLSARSLAHSVCSDRIHLKGLVFHGYHGVLPEENALGQKFIVSAVLHCDLRLAGQTDDVQDTVDYAKVYSAIKARMEGPPTRLLESLAERICQDLLQHDARIDGVELHIQKPHVAVPGVVDSLGISIARWRHQQQTGNSGAAVT